MCRSTSTSHPLTAWGLYLLCVLSTGLTDITGQVATFTATDRNDSGYSFLRQAVIDANAASGADQIVFQVGVTGTINVPSGFFS